MIGSIAPSNYARDMQLFQEQQATATGDPVPEAYSPVPLPPVSDIVGASPLPPVSDLTSGAFSLCGYSIPYWAAALLGFALLYASTGRRHI